MVQFARIVAECGDTLKMYETCDRSATQYVATYTFLRQLAKIRQAD